MKLVFRILLSFHTIYVSVPWSCRYLFQFDLVFLNQPKMSSSANPIDLSDDDDDCPLNSACSSRDSNNQSVTAVESEEEEPLFSRDQCQVSSLPGHRH